MLTEKKSKKASLSVVRKADVKSDVRIIMMKAHMAAPHKPGKKGIHLSPPMNQFNSGYIKTKKHDPL